MLNVIRYARTPQARTLMAEVGNKVDNAARFGLDHGFLAIERQFIASGWTADELIREAQPGDQLEDASGRALAQLGRTGWEFQN